MMDCKPIDTPLPIGQKLTKEMGPKDIHETNLMKTIPYVEAIGYLMYGMTSIHPNLAFLVGQVVQFMENLGLAHWTIVKCIFCYIKATKDMGIKYDGEGSKQDMLRFNLMD